MTIERELEVTILRLASVEKWPSGTIASQLGLHHSVIERVLRDAGSLEPREVRPSIVDPYLPFIQQTWARWPLLPASRLWAMCRERGYPGAKDHFRHMVKALRPRRPPEAFLRLRTLPGEHYVERGVMLSDEHRAASESAFRPIGNPLLRIIPMAASSVRRATGRRSHDRPDAREGLRTVVPRRGSA